MLTRSISRTASLLLCLFVLMTLSIGYAHADDEQVWAALKQGGKVILLRHTHVEIQEGIGHLAPGNCAKEVNLSSRGVEQAKYRSSLPNSWHCSRGDFDKPLLPLRRHRHA